MIDIRNFEVGQRFYYTHEYSCLYEAELIEKYKPKTGLIGIKILDENGGFNKTWIGVNPNDLENYYLTYEEAASALERSRNERLSELGSYQAIVEDMIRASEADKGLEIDIYKLAYERLAK